jgi:hypothetical protein
MEESKFDKHQEMPNRTEEEKHEEGVVVSKTTVALFGFVIVALLGVTATLLGMIWKGHIDQEELRYKAISEQVQSIHNQNKIIIENQNTLKSYVLRLGAKEGLFDDLPLKSDYSLGNAPISLNGTTPLPPPPIPTHISALPAYAPTVKKRTFI